MLSCNNFSAYAETWAEKKREIREESIRFIVPRTVVVADRDYFMCNLNSATQHILWN